MRILRPSRFWLLAILLGVAPGPAAAQEGGDPDTTVLFPLGNPSLLVRPVLRPSIPPTPPPPPPTDFNPGNMRLAIGEALLSNFVPWAFNEYVSQYKDITRISPTRWKENVGEGLLWDDNHFHVNMLMHPYAGSLSFAAGRTNGYNFEQSFFFSALASAFWECCGESHRPSPGDFVSTTIGGTLLGEIFYRWTSQLLNRRYRAPPNGWWEVPVAVLSPVRTFTRWTLGRFGAINPVFDSPNLWALHTKTGARTGPWRAIQEVDYTYGDLVKVTARSRPFSHFETAVELAYGNSTQPIGRVQARGSLWSRRLVSHPPCLVSSGSGGLGSCLVQWGNIIPFLGFDYIQNASYEFGGQSAGVAAFVTIGHYPGGTYGVLSMDGHGMFGGVESIHAKNFQRLHDARSEREREYDFTGGAGWTASGSLSHHRLHLSAFFRKDKHWVINGSNYQSGPANHQTKLLGVTARYKFLGRLGAGAEFRRYHRESQFHPSLSPSHETDSHNQFGFFLTLDRVRPPGLFVF